MERPSLFAHVVVLCVKDERCASLSVHACVAFIHCLCLVREHERSAGVHSVVLVQVNAIRAQRSS
eukprot:3506176-Prymnesium_polylepis.1